MFSSLAKMRHKLHDTAILARLYAADRRAFQVIRRVISERLTYLDASALADLYDAVRSTEREGRAGALVEAGVALGGSSLVMATAKEPTRPFYMFDAYEMIPAPSQQDGADAHNRYKEIASGSARGIRGADYYGYQQNLYDRVHETLSEAGFPPEEHQIKMVRGYYEESLHVPGPVALAHLDCDWYDSVMVCLERIEPHLVKGGRIIVDDYEHWSGCRKAVDEYFKGREEQFRFEMGSRLHLIRK